MSDIDVEREEQIDLVMRALFDAKVCAPEPVGDAAWLRWKMRFRTSARILREDAINAIEDEEWFE